MSAEQHVYPPPAAAVKNAWVSGMPAYQALCDEAARDYEALLGAAGARADLVADAVPPRPQRRHAAVLQVVRGRHAQRLVQLPRPQRRAGPRRQDGDHLRGRRRRGHQGHATRELLERTCKLANAMKARGLVKGDRVVIYMPMSIEGVVAMLACARIGATHSVVFGGFSAQSLRDRIADTGAVMVITADEQMRGGKALPLKAIVDEALDRPEHGGARRHRLPAHRRQGRLRRAARQVAARAGREGAGDAASRNGCSPSIRCSCSTPRARPASPRACSTRPAATCCTRR